ncbi:serine hydrolase domain-containing protein [Colwellia psychrerythraea]|uniref:Beta-lactamase n=1 Tax=Colwellia psychrerythraea TaxID=28229 RepID=A0A099KLV3_COLPS|nr:serine hydrolase [Colwellia psychrerythraea]KGJ91744.1 beta-lactamase [Colwellia psychrerythraea]
MIKMTYLALLSTVLATSSVHNAQATDFSALTKFVKQAKATTALPSGTAIAIIKDGKIIYQQNFGYSDIANKKPVTEETTFYVASTTKPFYALSTLIDIDNKELQANDTLASLFPKASFKQLSPEVLNRVTVQDLLVHGSGIENEDLGWAVAYTGIHDLSSRKQMLFEQTTELEKNKHGEFDYTNFGYNLLSVWSDSNNKLTWQEKMQNNVFTPLGMKHTSSVMSTARKNGDVAKPYSFINSIEHKKTEPLYLEKVDNTMHSAGGMVTSASDMAQMVIAQLNQGKVNGKQVIPASIIKTSQSQQIIAEGKYDDFIRDGYAWGWFTGDYHGERMLHHLGGFAGTHALISFMPEKNIGLVVLNNEDFISRRVTGAISHIAYSILLGQSDGTVEAKSGLETVTSVAEEMPTMLAKHKAKLASREWQLSNDKKDYSGKYAHPTLGSIEISLDDEENFALTWGQLKTSALAFTKPNSIRTEFVMFNGNMLQFNQVDNEISSLSYDGNTFKKQ